MKSKVGLTKCERYKDVKDALTKVLKSIDCFNIFKNKDVLLKVNVGKGKPPERAVSTHPEFIRAMIQIIKSQGAKAISVGDSSAALGFTAQAFKSSGIQDIVSEEGATLINFDASRIIKRKIDGRVLKTIYLPEDILKTDLLISLPKLKTHTLTLFTGAVKNQLGLIPGAEKCRVHQIAPRITEFSQALIDINLAVKFDLAVMDGVVGLEGGGTSKGIPKRSNFIAASTDLVALDAICSYIIGLEPLKVPTTKLGEERNLGINNLNEIEIVGEQIEKCIVRFKKTHFDLKKIPFIAKILYKIRRDIIKPIVIKEHCTQCMICKDICPVNAIILKPYPIINKDCINCYSCYENCPSKTIKLKCELYLKPILKRKIEDFGLFI